MLDSPVLLPTGTTLRMVFAACKCDVSLYTRAQSLVAPLETAIREVGLTPLSHAFHDFDQAGCTLCLILAESHVAVHTWPELDNTVLIELSVCDHQRSNHERVMALGDRLRRLFRPARFHFEEAPLTPRLTGPATDRRRVALPIEAVLHSCEVDNGTAGVVNTSSLGKVFSVDGEARACEFHAEFHAEALALLPLIMHGNPRSVLLIGPEDGAVLSELVRHPQPVSYTMLSADEALLSFSQRHLEFIHKGAFGDQRVQVRIGDPRDFLVDGNGLFDVIIVDDNALPLNSVNAGLLRKHLDDSGLLCVSLGCLSFHSGDLSFRYRALKNAFASCSPYTAFRPLRGASGLYVLCSVNEEFALPTEDEIAKRFASCGFSENLSLLCPSVARSLFALPPCYSRLIEGSQ